MKALITGAAQGIGAAIARWVDQQGGVSVGLDRNEIGTDIPVSHRIVVDLTDMEAMQRAFADAHQHLGGIDHMFLNAGIATGTPIAQLDLAPYRSVMGVNVDAMIIGTALGLRMMTEGHIILTASLAGLMPLDLDPIYTASKHAIVGFTRGRQTSIRTGHHRASALPRFHRNGNLGYRHSSVTRIPRLANHVARCNNRRRRLNVG